ncbi:uncharacterized protein DDB_G0283697-like isoform X2 [Clytia hemisphaerica]|uniref:uncharacterized protein DDB_G0283697-like isoform X2 n=1 Tax=Clytia hemisphaerica TaxID=252671 RepID=UPI0034D549AE
MVTQSRERMVWWFCLSFLFGRAACFIDQDVHHQRRAGHHSNYEVHHHMGKMKIHTNPDGADFDFSGGDLHVDLHPAHSDVFPIYNYFHSDYHDDHHEEQEEEGHHFEPFHEMHHGSGDHHHSMTRHHMPEHGYGENEQGGSRMMSHDNGGNHAIISHEGSHHGMSHGHHGMSHSHGHHGMSHGHGHHDEEEIAADHGHEHMPHLFPIGMHHPGMHGGHVGHHGSHHGGCCSHGYGKNIVPGQQDDSSATKSNFNVNKLVPSDASMGIFPAAASFDGKKPVLDFVAESANIEMRKQQGAFSTRAVTPEKIESFVATRPVNELTPNAARLENAVKRSMGILQSTRQKRMKVYGKQITPDIDGDTETMPTRPNIRKKAERRTFLRPVNFKGSILDSYKKHWDDDEDDDKDEKQEDEDTEEEDEKDEEEDGDDEDDDEQRRHRHHRRHHHHRKHHTVSLDDQPEDNEYNKYNQDKKLYPGGRDAGNRTGLSQKSDKAEPVKEVVDPEYKINDKLTAQEAQLEHDMQKEKNEEKELKHLYNKHHHHRHHKHKHGRRHHGNKHKHHGRHSYHKDEEEKDETEEKIEKEEKEIEKESAKHFHKHHHHHHADTDQKEADDVINTSIEDKSGTKMSGSEDTEDDDEKDDKDEDDDKDDDDDDDGESETKTHHHHGNDKFKFAGSDSGMKGEELRQHKFHDKLAHKTMHNFHEIEHPHEGEEKFEKDGEDGEEEIDINDKTGEGDKDEDSVEKRLEEAKARLPLRFGKEAEKLRHYGDVKEWGTENEKETADEEMSKHFEQNEDKKLEGADHDFYNDKPNFNDEAEKQGEEEQKNRAGEWHEGDLHQEGPPPPPPEDDHGAPPPEEEGVHFEGGEGGPDGPPPEIEHSEAEWRGPEDGGGPENEDHPPPEMGDRRGLTTRLNKTVSSISIPVVNVKSFSQKDIYEALKKQEMSKTLKNVETGVGRQKMFQELKSEMKNEDKLPNVEQRPITDANIYDQLKKDITSEERQAKATENQITDTQRTINEVNIFDQLKKDVKTDSQMSEGQTNDLSNKAIDPNEDIIQKPENAKMVDNKLLKDFKQRFTEENGFQSAQSADQMLNQLQELALTNQKQIDANQANGDFYKTALSSKRQELQVASSSDKRHIITNLKSYNKLSKKVKKVYTINKMKKKVKRKHKHKKLKGRHLRLRKHKLRTLKITDGLRKQTVRYFSRLNTAAKRAKLG